MKPPWQATSDTHAVRCHIPLAELSARETWSKRISAVQQGEKPRDEPLKGARVVR